MPTDGEIKLVLEEISKRYPDYTRGIERLQIPRYADQIEMVFSHCPKGSVVCDVGSGIGMYIVALASLGMQAISVDDFADHVRGEEATVQEVVLREIFPEYGVKVIRRDVMAELIDFEPCSIDGFTCLETLEHFHHSPKKLLHKMFESLRPGGWMMLGTPNAMNLRKRLSAPFGLVRWSAMADWYEREIFRGHVREPVLNDLIYMARDIGLTEIQTFGRNWHGLRYPHPLVRRLIELIDPLLRLRPSLCSCILVSGRKP